MRVYYVSSGNAGCYIVRCLLPLVANGWDGDQVSLNLDTKTPENKTLAATNSDIVVFHRPDCPEKFELARILKKAGKKIVFDNDDTYKDHDSVKLNDWFDKEKVARGMAKLNKNADSFAIEADLVTTTTEWLADEYRKLNPNVVVLPNCVDPFYFDEPSRNETDVVRIGVTGSIINSTDLDLAAPIIRHYEKDKRVKIVFFGLQANRKDNPMTEKIYSEEYKFLDSVDVEWHPAVNADVYYDKLNSLKLDMMIIPREDNYFNRAKSNLKWLEASMFEIPCLCSGFPDGKSPYQVNPHDRENLVLVNDVKDWIPAIENLINNKQLRVDIGRRARQYVIENYNINDEKNYKKWYNAYESILEK